MDNVVQPDSAVKVENVSHSLVRVGWRSVMVCVSTHKRSFFIVEHVNEFVLLVNSVSMVCVKLQSAQITRRVPASLVLQIPVESVVVRMGCRPVRMGCGVKHVLEKLAPPLKMNVPEVVRELMTIVMGKSTRVVDATVSNLDLVVQIKASAKLGRRLA